MQSLTALTIVAQASLLIFIVGSLYRLAKWLRGSSGSSHSSPLGFGGWLKVLFNAALDLALMRKVFRSNVALGFVVWLMHMTALALIIGHTRAFGLWSAESLSGWMKWLMLELVPTTLGWLLFILILALLLRRLRNPISRRLFTFSDGLLYALLLLGVLCGNLMRALPASHEPFTWQVLPGLTLSLEHTPNLTAFTLHVLILSALLAYLPFSPLIHIASGVISSILHYKWRAESFKRGG